MKSESEALFVKQLKENQNIIHKICRLYTTDEDSHNDLFQEITIQLWKAFPNFRGDSKFTTWAYRVGLNTAITLYRKKKRTIDTIEFDSTFHKVTQDDYNFEDEEKLKLLYSAISELNDIEKALVFLYLEDKDYTEISETLGISEVNARVKMNRVKGKLKKNIKSLSMDELELLKKDWKKQESSFQQIGENEIYGMLHKRSSSIVKWIVVISILELILWSSISLFTADEDYFKLLKIYHLDTAMPIIGVINYGVILYFIYLFYKNYKAINATDTIKQLMKSILKTRKTVKYYVWYNLGMTALSFIIVFVFQFMYDPNITKLVDKISKDMDTSLFYCIMIVIYTVIIAVFIGIIWLFYRLLYGILMKRLQKTLTNLKK